MGYTSRDPEPEALMKVADSGAVFLRETMGGTWRLGDGLPCLDPHCLPPELQFRFKVEGLGFRVQDFGV